MRSGWLIEGNNNTIHIDDQYQRTISGFPTIADGIEAYSPGSEYDVGPGIQAFESNDRYDYMFGDATNAYDSNEVEKFLRQILYLKPDKFIIFDQVVTKDSTLKKSWFIDPGVIPQAIGDTLILIDNSSGALWMKKMLPISSNQILSADYVKVAPSDAATEDFFLFVLQATDAGLSQFSPEVIADQAELLVDDNKVGVFLDGWNILFNTTGSPGVSINDEINDPPNFFNLPNVTFPEDSLALLDLDTYVFDLDHGDEELNLTASIIDYSPNLIHNNTGETGNNKIRGSDDRILDMQDLQIAIDTISHITTFTMTNDSSGLFRISFTVTDPEGLSDTDTINVTVTPVNDAPQLFELPLISFNEDESLNFLISQWYDCVEDIDNLDNALIYSVKSGNNIQAIMQGATYVFSSSPDFFGEQVLQLVVSDEGQLSDSAEFGVFVQAINDAPSISQIPDITFDEDSLATLNLDGYASDIDHTNDELNFNASIIGFDNSSHTKHGEQYILNFRDLPITKTLSIADLNISIDASSHIATFTTTSDSNGIFTVVITVSDPQGLDDLDTILVTVNPVSDAPYILELPLLSFNEDDTLYFLISRWYDYVYDIDDADQTLSFFVHPGRYVNAVQQDALYIFSSNPNFSGLDTLLLMVSDDSYLSDSAQFHVKVSEINDPPDISGLPDSISFPRDSMSVLNIWACAEDIETEDSLLTYLFKISYIDSNILDSLIVNYENASGILSLSSSGFEGKSYLKITVVDDSAARAEDSVLVHVKFVPTNGDIEERIPKKYALYQNYPNPFNAETKIKYDIVYHCRVKLKLYDVTGKEIMTLVDEDKTSGSYAVSWDGTNTHHQQVSSGVYFYSLDVFNNSALPSYRQTQKMLLLR
jgi:hypothetical protein